MKKLLSNLFNNKNKSKTISFAIVIFAYAFIEIMMHTTKVSRLFTSLLVPTCAYIVIALALNLVVGFSGELSLGHAGFMAIGAFTSIILTGILQTYINNEILLLVISLKLSFVTFLVSLVCHTKMAIMLKVRASKTNKVVL